ncbi:MAG TPA: ABC transporter permease, partial [Chloroflexota bacterium]|nr:ABC transporter permease [Chloroflexota bacterium]
MSFLPIVERELRVLGRAKWTYRGRMLSALTASSLAGLVLLWAEATRGAGNVGLFMFQALGWAVFLYCLMQGARNTADCLSEEKRAGTLGLLFLTDLRGYDVALGKLLATSLSSFYGLLAVFPPLGIPLVLGGVTAGEFWRMVLALIVTLLFALTAGLLVSSMSRDE